MAKLNLNIIHIRGALTRDVEMRYMDNGTAISKTALASSREFSKNGRESSEVCFIDLVFFGVSAEVAHQYLKKGSNVIITGQLMFSQWTDQAGVKRNSHNIKVKEMEIVSTPGTQASQTAQDMPQTQGKQDSRPQQQQHMNGIPVSYE